MVLDLEGADLKAVLNRLLRAQAQVSGVIRMIAEECTYEGVTAQLAAAARVLDRGGFAIIATGLHQYAAEVGRTAGTARTRKRCAPAWGSRGVPGVRTHTGAVTAPRRSA